MIKSKYIRKKKGKIIKNIARLIFNVFNNDIEKSYSLKQIASEMKITNAGELSQIIKIIKQLVTNKSIIEITKGSYKINEAKNFYTGTLDINTKGNGYFVTDDLSTDVFIASTNLNNSLNGDLVKVCVYNNDNDQLEGIVVQTIERSIDEFVGVLHLSKTYGFVILDNKKIPVDIFVSKRNLYQAEDGDKVLVKFTDWPKGAKNPFGKIIRVLGKPGEHQTEMHAILSAYGLPYEFPKEVLTSAEKIPTEITEKEISKRRDMRKVLTFTIDPTDAKDFDDALSFKKLPNNNYEVGIHIADVSHYLQAGTVLDEEAYNRATSVYLVDRVVPMLPEILSNGVCSLIPKQEKLTFSAVFELNEKAAVVNQWFGRTVIYSDSRFSYEEAQTIIDYKNGSIPKEVSLTKKAYQVEEAMVDAILKLSSLSKKLRKKRMNQGAIAFDKTEVKFRLDEKANPIAVYFKEAKQANKLIEEFMLLANKKVAEFVGQNNRKPTKNTFIYRVHEQPKSDRITDLQDIVGKFGYKINRESEQKMAQSLNELLKAVRGKQEENMIETLVIRSMSKAKYTTKNIGHYGLAFAYYSHFTSPIRRYPDVMTHRLLQHYLDGGKSPESTVFEQRCKHASTMEELATKAERDSIKYMQVKYMQNRKEESFEGVISGVTEWGIYVEIKENKCEGMVRIKDIKGDYYIFDQKQYALIGKRTNKVMQLGGEVNVKIKKAILEKKQLDFYLV